MSIGKSMIAEYDHEMATTRTVIERVPDDKYGWKPHDKSMSMGDLISHLATMPGWAVHTINEDSTDIAPEGGEPMENQRAGSRKEALDLFDQNFAKARAAIESASDDHLMKSWSLMVGGKTVFTMPRVAVLRSFVLNHNVHHRGQLSVYLRLNDIPVPSIYGPSADEGSM